MIEFLNLKEINKPYFEEFQRKVPEFLESGWYILGKEVKKFENNFATFVEAKSCVGVANGLDAIKLILLAYKELGKLKSGDEVLLASNSYIATVLAVVHSGLKPKFVEVDKTYNLDPKEVQKAITKKTKAILATSLYGQSANYEELKKFGLLLIDDAAQAHGSCHHDRKNGSVADATAFSFYPTKNLGALGDGGAVTTDDEELALMIKKLRNYGSSKKNIHDIKGLNSRLDELQALFLNIKLPHLESITKKRASFAKFYMKNIKNPHITLPYVEEFNSPSWHLFVVRVKQREKLQNYLLKKGIQTAIHYPTPVFRQKAFSELKNLEFIKTQALSKEVLSLPLNESMNLKDIEYITEILNNFSINSTEPS